MITKKHIVVYLVLLLSTLCSFSQAGVEAPTSTSLTYQGRILRPDGTALEHSNVSFLFQITDPTGQCVLYQEHVNGINMKGSKGVFDISIGTGTISWPQAPANILTVFNNGISHTCGACEGYDCSSASTYSPKGSDGRFLQVSFYDGTGWKQISPSTSIRSVPFAGYAQSAQKLGSYSANDFVLKSNAEDFILKSSVNSSASCSSGKFLTWNAANSTFGCDALPTNSANTMGGDILGTSSAATVDKIQSTPVVISGLAANHVLKYSGGNWINSLLTTSDISNLTTTLNDYVTFNKFASCGADNTLTYSSLTGSFICTPIAISGSQVSGNLTGNLTGNVTGSASLNVLKAGDTMTGSLTFNTNTLGTIFKGTTGTVSLQGPNGAIAANYILRLPTSTPSSAGQALVSDTSGNLSWQTLLSGSIDLASGVSGVLPVASGGTGVSSFTNNRIIASDATGKLSSFNAGATNTILQQGASGPAWTTATYPTTTSVNQLLYSSANNTVTGLATANSAVLITNSSGVPSFQTTSGDLFSQYARLNGRAANQVLTGGTTANGTLTLESTSSLTKGNIILNPTGGNVGIGTTNPTSTFHVENGPAFFKNNSNTEYTLRVENRGGSALGVEIVGGANYGTPLLYVHSDYTNDGASNRDGLVVQSNGNVGIGTINPSTQLHIKSPTGGNTLTLQGTSTKQAAIAFSDNNVSETVISRIIPKAVSLTNGGENSGLSFETISNGTLEERMIITGSGNVGIGTTNPQTRLHLSGTTGNLAQYITVDDRTPTSTPGIFLANNYASTPNLAGIGLFPADNSLRFTVTNSFLTPSMTILPNGNVGIGTPEPIQLLHIASKDGDEGNPGIFIQDPTTGNDFGASLTYDDRAGLNGLRLATISSGVENAYLFINRMNANIGIGTTTPTSPLHVNGAALATVWNTSSDSRLKANISEIKNPLEKILSLRGVEFDWRADIEQPTKHDQIHDIGVIAQEVEAVFPEAVTTGNDGFKAVAYSKLVSPIIAAIKAIYVRLLDTESKLQHHEDIQNRQLASFQEMDYKISLSKDQTNERIKNLEEQNHNLKKRNIELEERLSKIETFFEKNKVSP